ncbi:hypothetical protein OBBRIDRAFT_795778 [Obba rivulosa]|uniref:Uncharacterized protein n=1 Tax=Obba rivulosa TaxID=1052685 RepID=A0A8E2DI71_9APHY|nr:hypothetical protein OBBRIDRAFT_795778 [Obba rivulosa]
MSDLPYPFSEFACDNPWAMAPVTPYIPHSYAIASTTNELPFPFNEFSCIEGRNVPQRVLDTHKSYTAMGLDRLLRDPPPRIARSARHRVVGNYLGPNPRFQMGSLYGRNATQNAQNLAQYSLSIEPRRRVNVPPTRPSQRVRSMQNEFGFGKLQAPTNGTWSAQTHSLPGSPHDVGYVTGSGAEICPLPTSLAPPTCIDNQQDHPGLWAEALQLQLIPPDRAVVSTGAQSVNSTPGTASAAGADHAVHPNTRHRDMSPPRVYQNPTPIAEPSSGLDDVSPRKKDGAVQQAETFPSFTGRQPPGGACSGCAEAGKKCDGVTGSGVACE